MQSAYNIWCIIIDLTPKQDWITNWTKGGNNWRALKVHGPVSPTLSCFILHFCGEYSLLKISWHAIALKLPNTAVHCVKIMFQDFRYLSFVLTYCIFVSSFVSNQITIHNRDLDSIPREECCIQYREWEKPQASVTIKQ